LREQQEKYEEGIQRLREDAGLAGRARDSEALWKMKELEGQCHEKIPRITEEKPRPDVNLEQLKLQEEEKAALKSHKRRWFIRDGLEARAWQRKCESTGLV